MRVITVLAVLLALALCGGVALADPTSPPEQKPWSYDFGGPRATYPEVEPNDTCPTAQIVLCGDVVDPATIASGTDVDWYTLANLPGGTIIVAGTDASGLGDPDLTDSYIELYYNCGTARVAYDDDGGPGLYSLMTYTVPAGSPGNYSIKVRGYNSSYTGYYMLTVTCTIPQPPPVNDLCSGAVVINRCESSGLSGDLTWANNNYDPLSGGCASGFAEAGKDVAYVVALQAGDVVDLTYTGSNYDASIYMVTDCSNVPASCVIGADASYNLETIHWVCTATGTYYIICDAYGTNTGSTFTLAWTVSCPGACCALDGTCALVTQVDCLSMPDWTWYGGPCDPNPCPPPPVWACCLPPGPMCEMITEAECAALNGVFNPGMDCDPNPCPGACCHADGSCTWTYDIDCDGYWLGIWQCDPNPCPPPIWSCCLPPGPMCVMVTLAECDALGGIWGPGFPCDPNPCPGACCYTNGSCAITYDIACDGLWLGVWDCLPNPCPQPTACCFLDGHCEMLLEDLCLQLGGVPQPGVGACDPNPCPQPLGACCFPDGTCWDLTEEDCQVAQGSYLGDFTDCDPNLCPPNPVERTSWGQIKNHYR